MERVEFAVKGMSCATCALNVENVIKKAGIKEYSVNFASESGYFQSDNPEQKIEEINKMLKPIGYEILTKVENIQEIQLKEKIERLKYILPISAFIFIFMIYDLLSMVIPILPKIMISYSISNGILLILSTIVLFSVGRPFLRGIQRFIEGNSANMDTLVGIGTFTAYTYSLFIYLKEILNWNINLGNGTFFDAVIVVIGFVYLGKYLEYRSRYNTGEAIKKLATLQAKTAILIKGNRQEEIPISQIVKGDILLVQPGAKIPVDGEITNGTGVIDMSMLTGEPIPKDVQEGDSVYDGTVNVQGTFMIKASKVGEATALANIIKIVRDAQNSKAEIQKTVDKISSIFVPVILGIALLSIITWVASSFIFNNPSYISLGISSFVAVLVIACPCALGLATPTAIIVGVGKAAENGILVKNAESLEKLNKIDTIIFDKTGTLTEGKPKVESIEYIEKEEYIDSIFYSLELSSQHPLANAIASYFESRKTVKQEVKSFKNIDGKGINGIVNGEKYYIGKPKYIEDIVHEIDSNLIAKYENLGKTVILLSNSKKLMAIAVISDRIKEESQKVINNLHSMNIETVMITGDNKYVAKDIAQSLNIDKYYADILPDEKASFVKEYQSKGRKVAMIGDGINDAPALALSDVSIAMSTGTDIAMSTADITLLSGNLNKIPTAFKISKGTINTIKQNLFWAFIYNLICVPIAAGLFYPITGLLLNPIFAGLAMALSSVSVVTNSLRLKLLNTSND